MSQSLLSVATLVWTSLVAAAVANQGCSTQTGTTPNIEPRNLHMSQTAKRVLIIATSHATKGLTSGQATGAYVPEISHPYDAFAAAGYQIEFASIKGGTVPLDGLDSTDASAVAFLKNSEVLAQLHASKPTSEVAGQRYDAIFFAGGHGTMWDFPNDAASATLAAKTYEHGGVVGAVCHGPAALVNAKLSNGKYLVAGKDVSAFTDEEERAAGLAEVVPFLLQSKLAERGANMKPVANWQKQVIVSDRLVTGQNPASARGVADAMVGVMAKVTH
jgi:putative intracellular protease/amidase